MSGWRSWHGARVGLAKTYGTLPPVVKHEAIEKSLGELRVYFGISYFTPDIGGILAATSEVCAQHLQRLQCSSIV